jgi:polyhydroxybutyrate depolymerase
MRFATLLCLLFLGAVPAFAAPQAMTWTVDGLERHAIVFTPSKPPATGVPVVFVFHGAGDTAQNFSSVGFQRAWPEALIVYMDGVARAPGQGGAFQTSDPGAGNRDLKFFDRALGDLRQRFAVDGQRIYATGFSNGAKFVYLLWATRPAQFAAFAPVAGMLAPGLTLSVPKPVLHIGGREDHQNDFQLQMESVAMARRVNGAAAPVMTILHAGGHFYPDDATANIVDFFRAHPSSR